MRFVMIAGLALLQVSCGMNSRSYIRNYSLSFCEKVFECYDQNAVENAGYGADVPECQVTIAASLEAVESTCDHDPMNAQLCVEALESLDCDDFTSGRLPSSCDEVCI